MTLHKMMSKSGGMLTYYGQDAELELGGRRIFATHFPRYGRGIACTGDYDLVCCGHSHVAEIIQQPNIKGGKTLLVKIQPQELQQIAGRENNSALFPMG